MFDKEDTGDLNVDVGRRLKRFRQWVACMTQADFGAPVGLLQTMVTQIESGKKALSIENALLIVEQHHLTLDWLYRGESSNLRHADLMILVDVQNKVLAGENPKPPPTLSSLARKSG